MIILASQSKARKRLLKRLGLAFRSQAANLDEAEAGRGITEPQKLVRHLARLKAQKIFDGLKKPQIVIGSDQVLVCEGRIYGKPGSLAGARGQLAKFSGRQIELMTAVCVLDLNGRAHNFVHRTRMKFRNLSTQEIQRYVQLDQPTECAGSFMFEEHGITLFESVKTDDPTAIEGLPLLRLAGVLRRLHAFSE